jgi:hypothetical protein
MGLVEELYRTLRCAGAAVWTETEASGKPEKARGLICTLQSGNVRDDAIL